MNLHENINRIKQVMGVLNEQSRYESVSHTITQPYPNPNWDTVHGFSLKGTDDDLAGKVSMKLKTGLYRVAFVDIYTFIKGNTIVTKGDVDLYKIGKNEIPHIDFTTRGSIGIPGVKDPKTGETYIDRYDKQVKGLEDKLKAAYKTNVIKTFGPFDISIDGDNHKYKQKFYAIEKATKTQAPVKTNSTAAAATITPAIQSPRDGTNATVINPIIQSKKDTASVNTTVKPTKDTAVVKQNTSTDKKTTVAAETAEVENIKRPAGDPYVYGKNKNGEYLAYRCGKNQACPSPNQIPWINITQGKKNNKPKYADYESAIKTLIYNE